MEPLKALSIEYIGIKLFGESDFGADKNMYIVFGYNSLLYYFMIIFSSKYNSFSITNTIDHQVLLGPKKFQRHENKNNPSKIKDKKN